MSSRRGTSTAAITTLAAPIVALLLASASNAGDDRTLRLHPENPRYFEWRGMPLAIVGSGEHYGAVVNADFDFRKYLAALGRDGLNHTRLFTGAAYVEPSGAFNIERNTLAPRGDRFLAPWARSDQPGYDGGGNRFDLERWDEPYFRRLREFVDAAARHKVIVEVNLFCPFYEESQWRLSPFNPGNNINGAGRDVARTNVYTLDRHGGLLAYQERFVRRVVDELRGFDNLYYEICNEPYFGGVTLEWQAHIAAQIASAQRDHANPKLISQNIANNQARVDRPLPNVSVYNFHYATPPDTVALNAHLKLPIGDNETGFRGTTDAPYRMEAWDFMLAGGALFSHLDYSFTAGHEDGTFAFPATQPGGGNPALRRQFRRLREFLGAFNLLRVAPDRSVVTGGVPATHSVQALVEPGRVVGLYMRPSSGSAFSVRWTGTLEAPESAEYTIHAASNDGTRVWVDDTLVIDRWVEQSESDHAGVVRLEKGRHRFKAEYFYNGGQAAAKVSWSRAGRAKEPVPAAAFRQPDGSGPGLRAEYFSGREFDRPWETRIDAQIQFEWGTTSPFPQAASGAPTSLSLNLPEGRWRISWIDPVSGGDLKKETRRHGGGVLALDVPAFREDVALLAVRK